MGLAGRATCDQRHTPHQDSLSMQRRVKTYGKRSTRIITVQSTAHQPTALSESTNTASNNRAASISSEPSDEALHTRFQHVSISNSKPKAANVLRKQGGSAQPAPVNTRPAASQAKAKPTLTRTSMLDPRVSSTDEDGVYDPQMPQIAANRKVTSRSAEGKSGKAPLNNTRPMRHNKRFDESQASDSDHSLILPSRAGPRIKRRTCIVTDPSDSEPSKHILLPGTKARKKASSSKSRPRTLPTGHSSPLTSEPGSLENLHDSSIDSGTLTSEDSWSPGSPVRSIPTCKQISSHGSISTHRVCNLVRRAEQRNGILATPQLKASHLRQARNRKATPFRRVPRISLTSTETSLPSPFPSPGIQAHTPPRRRNRPVIDLSSSESESYAKRSSSLTWEQTIASEVTRLQDLSVSDASETARGQTSRDALLTLLEMSRQEAPIDFFGFLDRFKSQDLEAFSQASRHKARTVQRASLKYRKIGDASYSEVFGIGDVVIKIIPLALELDAEDDENEVVAADSEDGPFQSPVEGVLKEIMITKAAGDRHDGFITLLRCAFSFLSALSQV